MPAYGSSKSLKSSSSDHTQSNVDIDERTTKILVAPLPPSRVASSAPPDEEREIAVLPKVPQQAISHFTSVDNHLNVHFPSSFDAGGGNVYFNDHRDPPPPSPQSPPHKVERPHSMSSQSRHSYGTSRPTPVVAATCSPAPSISSSSAPQRTLQNLPFYPPSPSYTWTNDSTASKFSDYARPHQSTPHISPASSKFKRQWTLHWQRTRPSHGGVIQQEDFSSNMDSKTTVSIFTSALAISLLGYAHVKFSGNTNPKRSDDWITGLWTLAAVLSLGCTVLFGMTGVGYMWSLRAQADWLDFSEHTRITLKKWENSDWHWTWMFWYCIILDVMFILAPLTLLFGVVVFVWAEEKTQLAVTVTIVVAVVAIQWAFRFFMLFTCLWRFEYKVATRVTNLTMPLPARRPQIVEAPGRTAWPGLGPGYAGGMA